MLQFCKLFNYSNDPNTGLVRISNGLKLSDHQMVRISNGIWNPDKIVRFSNGKLPFEYRIFEIEPDTIVRFSNAMLPIYRAMLLTLDVGEVCF